LNCNGVIRELSSYIDGELELAVRQELERHLEHCKDCVLILDQTKKSVQMLCDSQPIPLPADLRSRLHAALREKMHKRSG
jgi:anti-sigma factor RsiW